MSLSKRKFYRTIVQIEILSETPYSSTDLGEIQHDINDGFQIGEVAITTDSEEIDVKTCVERLSAIGFDPEFFSLNKHGHDTDDYLNEPDDDDEGGNKIKKMKD